MRPVTDCLHKIKAPWATNCRANHGCKAIAANTHDSFQYHCIILSFNFTTLHRHIVAQGSTYHERDGVSSSETIRLREYYSCCATNKSVCQNIARGYSYIDKNICNHNHTEGMVCLYPCIGHVPCTLRHPSKTSPVYTRTCLLLWNVAKLAKTALDLNGVALH